MQQSSATTPSPPNGVELDPEQLSPGALRGLIEEFVTREGTDYGSGEGSGDGPGANEAEWSLEEKVTQVYRQLSSGEARIVFDFELESASIVSTPSSDAALGAPTRGSAESS